MKSLLIVCCILLASCSSGLHPIDPPDPSLVLHLTFNGGVEDVQARYAVSDTGTKSVRDRAQRSDRARSFDGVDDVLTIAHTDALDLDAGDAGYTLALWVRADASGMARIFEKWSARGHIPYPFSIQANPEGLWAVVYDARSARYPVVQDVWDGEWHHIAMRVDPANGEVSAFVDGDLYNSVSYNSEREYKNDAPIQIGGTEARGSDGGSRYFKGDLDDIRVYRRVLESGEILELAKQ